jgi:hypothetical protein
MTHYTVIVFDAGDKVDELIADYDENLEVELYPVEMPDEEVRECAKFYREKEPDEVEGMSDKDICIYKAQSWSGCKTIFNEDTGKLEKWSNYNPNSRYDYYGVVKNNFDKRGLPKFVPYSFVTPDGEWHTQGRMGWWACSHDEMTDEEWEKVWKDAVKNYKGKFTWLDCHI